MERLHALINRASLQAKAISCVAITSYILSGILFPSLASVFGMIPVNTIGKRFHMWNIVTAPYIELHLVNLVFHVAVVVFASTYLMTIWSRGMMIRFALVVNLGAYVCTFVSALILYQITYYEPIISRIYCGLGAYVAGLTVVAKQQIPEYAFQWNGVIEVRGKWLPFVLFVWTIMWAILSGGYTDLPITTFGIVVSWLYLRFYQKKEDGSVGDRGTSLAFKTLFPSIFHPTVDHIESLFTRLLECIGLIRTQESAMRTTSSSSSSANAETPLPMHRLASEEEKQKRREMANRVLEEYMSKSENDGVSQSKMEESRGEEDAK